MEAKIESEYYSDDVFNRVKDVLEEAMFSDVLSIDLNTRIIEDLGAESMDLASILIGLEDEFGGEIADEEMRNLSTVEDIVKYIIIHSQKS